MLLLVMIHLISLDVAGTDVTFSFVADVKCLDKHSINVIPILHLCDLNMCVFPSQSY